MKLEQAGFDPYNNKNPEERELSVDAIDLILTKDMKAFDKDHIVNPEHKGSGRKPEKPADNDDDQGSPWRARA